MTLLLDMEAIHIPVLAGELIETLDPQPGDTVIDCTFGGGGHARLVAERIGAEGTLIAIDRDPFAEREFADLSSEVACHTRFVSASFAEGLAELDAEDLKVDSIYFDLGISSLQVDTRERGFSYSFDAPLDMRMDPSQELTAMEVINEWDERRLVKLLREYGEERFAKRIAAEIVRRREVAPLERSAELVEAIRAAVPAPAQFAGGHPAKRSFQAIRIAVNDELGEIERALPLAFSLLADNGKMAAISFHSLEDRMVKRFFQARTEGCVCPPDFPVCICGREPEAELVTRKAIAPTPGEVSHNPRSRSARLRAIRKLQASDQAKEETK